MPQHGAQYTHVAANSTVVIKAAPGNLYAVVINTKGASSNTLKLYDNASAASGTLIASIDTTGGTNPLNFEGLSFVNGLTAIMATGTAADVTFVWA